jgi:hypothetical protein
VCLCVLKCNFSPPEQWVYVTVRILGELRPVEEARPVIEVGQQDVGLDAGVLEGDDAFWRALSRVRGHVAGP